MQELISVIIPTYNNEKYISRCIDSIINQTYQNIEIIIINDGSNDNTENIINSYAQKDERIIPINKENTGVSNTRNIGIMNANGKYITFIDSDDWIEKNFIEEMYKSIVRENVEIVRCNYFLHKNNKKIERKIKNLEYKKYENDLEIDKVKKEFLISNEGNENYVMLLMIKNDKKKILFDENLIYMEDVIYYFDLLTNKKSIYFLNEELYNYYSNEQSVTHSSEKNFQLINETIKVRETLFHKLDNININNSRKLKEIFNSKCLKILSVRLGRVVKTGIEFKEYKYLIEKNIKKHLKDITEIYNLKQLNIVEKIQVYLLAKRRINVLFYFYKLKIKIIKLFRRIR